MERVADAEKIPRGKKGTAIARALPTNIDIYQLIKRQSRPPKLTEQTAFEIVRMIARGETIVKCADALGVEPCTIYYWINHNEDFSNVISQARALRAHTHIEKSLSILEDNSKDLYDNGKVIAVNNAQINRDFRRTEFYKWLAGRFNPIYRDDLSQNQVNLQVNLNSSIDLPPSESRESWEARRKEAIQTIDIPEDK